MVAVHPETLSAVQSARMECSALCPSTVARQPGWYQIEQTDRRCQRGKLSGELVPNVHQAYRCGRRY